MRYIWILLILLPLRVYGGVVFEDNFDSQTTWTSANGQCNVTGTCTPPPPTGWTGWYNTGTFPTPTYHNVMNIDATDNHGVSGKAFIKYDESTQFGSFFSSDGTLLKILDTDQSEIYARIWIKFPSDFVLDADDVYSGKIFRIEHWDRGSPNYFLYFSSGYTGPSYIFNTYNSPTYGWRYLNSYRCDPQATDYYCPNNTGNSSGVPAGYNYQYPGNPTFKNHMGDGQWHRLDFRVKMNTYAGSGIWNADGIMQYWYDGTLIFTESNQKWINSGTDSSIGWNMVSIGGNTQNHWNLTWQPNHAYTAGDVVVAQSKTWTCLQNHTSTVDAGMPQYASNAYWSMGSYVANPIEQWYAIDDVVVSTTPIASDYVIGGTATPAISTGCVLTGAVIR